MKPNVNAKSYSYILIAVVLLIVATACGSRPSNDGAGEGESESASSAGSSVSEMPKVNFDSVAEQSGITTTTEIAAPSVDEEGPDLSLGERVYDNKCAECHGANAEGTPDKAAALTGLSQELSEFEDLLRTGGDLGPEHLFGTLDVSVNGLEAMHAYLQSLSN